MDVGCTAVCWSLNASTFIILFDMYIQHFPFHILLPSLFPLFLVETWEPISLGFHTLTPGMPQRLLVKLLVLFAYFFFFRQQFDGIYSRDTTLVLVNSLNGTGVHTCIITKDFTLIIILSSPFVCLFFIIFFIFLFLFFFIFYFLFFIFIFFIFIFSKFLYVFLTIKC